MLLRHSVISVRIVLNKENNYGKCKNGYFIKKVEKSPNGNIITELMDRTGAVIGSYIDTDLPVMNHKV